MTKQRFQVVPAVFILFRRGNEVLFLRRANTGYSDGSYSFPAGHLEGDEPAVMAAVREVEEEVGIKLTRDDLKLVHTLHRQAALGVGETKHERVDFFFEVTNWKGEPTNMEPHKCDELRWAPLDDLPEPLTVEVAGMLKAYAKGEPYSDLNF
jgi:8-oxo-dGTP pyrophosphatase MutT (NUDIX family)